LRIICPKALKTTHKPCLYFVCVFSIPYICNPKNNLK